MSVTPLEASLSAQLAEMLHGVWESFMLGEVEIVDPADSEAPTQLTSANVGLSGDGEAIIMVMCQPELAVHLSATMLGMGDDEVEDADVSDTIGEIANVVGGNVKAILAPNAVLSLPVVALKTTRPHVKDAVERDRVAFRWDGLDGWIAIWAPPL